VRITIQLMRFIYFFMKLRRTRERIVFISRQSDALSLDFALLIAELKKHLPSAEIVVLTRKMRKGPGLLLYGFHLLRQMNALATSKVCVLDSYCIPVSVLTHKCSLTVIQMWHAIGLGKKAGYSILDMKEGRSRKIAELLKMHRNYDIVFAGSEACIGPMAEVFGCSEEIVKIYTLPRADVLRDSIYASEKQREIFASYPGLSDPTKKNILYIPTQRSDETQLQSKVDELLRAVDFRKYSLIVKPHPLSHITIGDERVYTCDEFDSMDMLFAADFVITDYSSMLFDALLCGKPEYFFAFDLEEYEANRGTFIDYAAEIPGPILRSGEEVMAAIERGEFDKEKANGFLTKYVPIADVSATERIAELISGLI